MSPLVPFAPTARAGTESWLAALAAGRRMNQAAARTALASLDAVPDGTVLPANRRLVGDAVTETATAVDAAARTQSALAYLVGASLFGMPPRERNREPVRIDL